jgi:hypothetical protein
MLPRVAANCHPFDIAGLTACLVLVGRRRFRRLAARCVGLVVAALALFSCTPIAIHYGMINSFRHSGLERFFCTGLKASDSTRSG